MRRLWSHIALAATSLLMVGATFSAVVTSNKFNSNIEFENGQEMVFRINNKDQADGKPDFTTPITDDDAVKQIAKIMESRLETSNITRYKVETQGNDTLKVSFVQDTERQYEIIKSFLYYVPYVTLAVMTFPAIMEATQTPIAGIAAFAAGLIFAWLGVGLFPVAVICSAVVCGIEWFLV